MNIAFRKSFQKDAEKLPAAVKRDLAALIDTFTRASKLSDIPDCKKMTGFKNAWRIRLGNYRVGFFFENDIAEFVRVLNRKEIYRYFP